MNQGPMNFENNELPMYNSSAVAEDRGDNEKILAMAILSLGSLLSGLLPLAISERNRRNFPLITSLLLCFGAGVLLATALVHILPEVRTQMSSNFAEIALCGGFFIIYFIEEFIHYFFGEAIQYNRNDHHNNNTPALPINAQQHQTNQQNYGAINGETQPLIASSEIQHNRYIVNDISDLPHCDESSVVENAPRIPRSGHTEPCAQTMTGLLGLLVALSLHSVIEGLAIGVQNSAKKVIFLLGAVSCHKFVMGFCLGLEFSSSSQISKRSHIVGIIIFAFGAACGIAIGMIIVDLPNTNDGSGITLPIIQALAGGTLLYVTVCEVIPREKARWHQNRGRKTAGLVQFCAVLIGFTVMTVINYYFSDDDSGTP